MEMNGGSFKLWIFEALLCALILLGWTEQSWGWFLIYWIASAALLAIPIIGGSAGIMISLVLAGGISSCFDDRLVGWYVGTILFIILVFLNSAISISGHVLFGFSVVIFEAFVIAGTINVNTKQTILSVIVFIVLIALAFAPLIRLFEYIVLSIITLIELYFTMAKSNVTAPHTYIIVFLIFVLMAYFFYLAYFAIDYNGIIKRGKKVKIIKKVNKVLPQLEVTGTEFERILNRCNNEDERKSFLTDWDNYKLSLWTVIKSQNAKQVTESPFSFEEWYRANDRWRHTSYHHAYYDKQINEDRYLEKETERVRMLWVCEYCGRINTKDHYQCPACGAMQKLVIPEQKANN